MKKIRRLCRNWTQEDLEFLAGLGIEMKDPGLHAFEIEEGDTYFKIRERYKNTWMANSCYDKYDQSARDSWQYKHTKEEVLSSEYCLLAGMYTGGGYPQPEEDWGRRTFDIPCQKCDVGMIQRDNFRISKVPKNANIWRFTAACYPEVLFVKEDFYKRVFEPLGIGFRPIVYASGKIREGVVQLDIPIIDEDLDLSGYDYTICPACGQKKYVPVFPYPFFPLHEHPLPHIYKTKEQFGYYSVHRRIYISIEMAKQLNFSSAQK